jgi:hypothetical protein
MARHPDKALSPLRINAFKRKGRYTDGNGLYLVVDDGGAKRWLLRTVVHGAPARSWARQPAARLARRSPGEGAALPQNGA